MTGLVFTMEFDLEPVASRFENAAQVDTAELAEGLAELGVSQTQRRIESEKESPEGEAWQEWSSGYAETRSGGQGLLFGEGNLAHSIAGGAGASESYWGSNLIYAAIQHAGGTIVPTNAKALVFRMGDALVHAKSVTIPARPYLGISTENAREMEETALGFYGSILQ